LSKTCIYHSTHPQAVFPPITIAIMPTNPGFHPLLFSALHFLIFSLGDLLGQNICSISSLRIWSPYPLLTLSFSRTLFIPLFLACNLTLSSSRSLATPLINSDVLFFLILFAFGISSGYVTGSCMMSAPSLEHNPRLKDEEDLDTAATVAMFSLVSGLVLGSMASFGIRAMICGCNPFIH
jgi:equilibrative nucleoside transporter 1/2/3